MKEIEILVELKDSIEFAKSKLNEYKYLGVKKTFDRYYFDPLRDNLILNSDNKLMECCRIRKKNEICSVAYKVDIYEKEVWQYSNEYETEVNDFDLMERIFQNLGLKELITIDNSKHTFVKENFEIVIEDVKGLGNFLEVEWMEKDSEKPVNEIKKEIFNFIESLGLNVGSELNSGKPELMLMKSH
jgi:adenylate cyclase class 2